VFVRLLAAIGKVVIGKAFTSTETWAGVVDIYNYATS
jgi:hypothetical protein